jgi:hypothetical protein
LHNRRASALDIADRIVPIWPALTAAHPNLSFGDE